jgi:hypothetical protein
MVQLPEPADLEQETTQLLAAALQLRSVATRVGRLDVAAKADEAVVLIAGADDAHKSQRDGKINAVLKILDGLGF